MKLHNELPVYKATYDMLLEIFQLCRGFSREYKFTVGESLKKETIDLLTLIFRANSSEKKTYKVFENLIGLAEDRNNNGTYINIGNNGNWWSSTENSTTNAWNRNLNYNNGNSNRNNNNKQNGFSVRCLRDLTT
jgi:uncharacterized protein (TIGR02145 family)